MEREVEGNKFAETYNQLTELLGAIDKQPKSIEVVLDKRQLNIAEEAEKRYLGRPPYQYYSAKDLTMAFREGAEYADTNPKSPWISVEDDLPCNHKELIHSDYTDRVLVSSRNGFSEVAFMCIIEDVWEWNTLMKVSYWMPIPITPKE